MKIAILNDTHCGARNSSEVFMDYMGKFYEQVFFPHLIENGITNIIHLGDYYEHRKFVNFRALNHNRKVFLDKLREYKMHMEIIPGNHDVYYKNTNELCAIKELMGFYTDCVTVHMEPIELTFNELKIALIPWINNENYSDTMRFLERSKANVVGGHFELEGFEMMKGVKSPHGMETGPLDKFDLVLSGHFHTKSQQNNIHYLGSQYEFTWSDCDDPKYFHVLDTETGEIEAIRNPITIFDKIIYNDGEIGYNDYDFKQHEHKFVKVIVTQKKDLYGFDKFIDGLHSIDTHDLKIAEAFDEYLGESVEDEAVSIESTETLLDSYVESVQTDLEVDKLRTLMRDLYKEAQVMEVL